MVVKSFFLLVAMRIFSAESVTAQTVTEAQQFIKDRISFYTGFIPFQNEQVKLTWGSSFRTFGPDTITWQESERLEKHSGLNGWVRTPITISVIDYSLDPNDTWATPRIADYYGLPAVMIECHSTACIHAKGYVIKKGKRTEIDETRRRNVFVVGDKDMVPRLMKAWEFLLVEAGAKGSSF